MYNHYLNRIYKPLNPFKMSYTPILTDPTEEYENGKKCSNWYCEKILDCNDFDDICINCHNEPEEEETENN